MATIIRFYKDWESSDNFYSNFSANVTFENYTNGDYDLNFSIWYGNQDLSMEVCVFRPARSTKVYYKIGGFTKGIFTWFSDSPLTSTSNFISEVPTTVNIGLKNTIANDFIPYINGKELGRYVKAIPYQKITIGWEILVPVPSKKFLKCKTKAKIYDLPDPFNIKKNDRNNTSFRDVDLPRVRYFIEEDGKRSYNSPTTKDIISYKLIRDYRDVLVFEEQKPIMQQSPPPSTTNIVGEPKVNKVVKVTTEQTEVLPEPSLDLDINKLLQFEQEKFDKLKFLEDDIPLESTIEVPGLLSKEEFTKLNNACFQFFKERYGTDDKTTMAVALIFLIQMGVLYSTSLGARRYGNDEIVTKGKYSCLFRYSEIWDLLDENVDKTKHVNSMRTYLRHHSNFCTSLLLKGVIKPNVKLVSKHGIPKKFYPYCFDFSMVNAIDHGVDAVIANVVSKLIAIRSSNKQSNKIFNAIDVIDKVDVARGLI